MTGQTKGILSLMTAAALVAVVAMAAFILIMAFGGGEVSAETAVAPGVDRAATTGAVAPSCADVGEWIVRDLNERIDRVSDHRKLGTRHISIAPEGMRDYERVCLINIEDPQGDVTRAVGCSDRFGNRAKDGGEVSLLGSAQMCLAILRG